MCLKGNSVDDDRHHDRRRTPPAMTFVDASARGGSLLWSPGHRHTVLRDRHQQEPVMNPNAPSVPAAEFELRFASLFDQGRGYAFPCDAQGHVDMDTLSTRALTNYLCARTLIGRDFAAPRVQPLH
jgi:hypothetical protein